MTNQQLLIKQLESSVEFLKHLYATTKDIKQLDAIKDELYEAQNYLNRVKGGDFEINEYGN